MDVSLLVKDDALGKKHKNVAIAKSGIYQYHRSELSGLFGDSLNIPDEYSSRTIFNVYRPPEVLKDALKLFTGLPLTLEHPEDFVTAENIRDEKTGWIGWTGDSSEIRLLEADGEVTVNSTLNIVQEDGHSAYDHGIKEVSPGYAADFSWKRGTDKNGTEYQILMTKVNEVNHLAVTPQGRGGKDAAILDKKFEQTKETDMDEKSVLGFIQKTLKGMFSKTDKVLDSIPKSVEKFTDEQKDYLLKETHRLLQHRVSGKSFDSFYPLGYTKDDMHETSQAEDGIETDIASDEAMPDKEATDAGLSEKENSAHSEIEEGLKKDEEADKAEDSVESDMAQDAPATQTAEEGHDVIEPLTVKQDGSTLTTTPQAPARAADHDITVRITDSKRVVDSIDPFEIGSQIRNGFAKNKESK